METTEKTLEQKLAEKQAELTRINEEFKSLNAQIAERDKKNKPKDITDKINDYSDILSILGADESKDSLNINLFDEAENKVVKNFIKKMRICKVYNEGILPKRGEQRWYNWYDVSSGFVFGNADCDGTYATTGSASRLSFRNEKLLRDFTKKFQDVDEAIIDMQE